MPMMRLDDGEEEAALSAERIAELGAAEQFILTIADDGMGKRASAYDYRVTGRGGKGLVAHNIWGSNKKTGHDQTDRVFLHRRR